MHPIIWGLMALIGIGGLLAEKDNSESQKPENVKSDKKNGTEIAKTIDTGKNHAKIDSKPAEPVTVTDEGETELLQESEPCPESNPSSQPPPSS